MLQAQTVPTATIERSVGQTLAGKSAVVVVFTSSHCRFATQYTNRLNRLSGLFANKNVAFVAINSNDAMMSPGDGEEEMRAKAVYLFPYLKDTNQALAKLLNAEKTPEAFVLVPNGANMSVVYKGAIDDNPLDENMVKSTNLQAAIEAALTARAPVASPVMMGCPIKWTR